MALSVVMAVTNSDMKSMSMIKNRLKLTEALCIQIPVQDYHVSESAHGFNKFTHSTKSSTSTLLKSSRESSSFKNTKSNLRECSKQNKESSEKTVTMRVTYSNRDILNLGANLREPSWHRWDPRKPQYDSVDNIPITCNSVFYRLDGRNNCREDFPVKFCRNCEFPIPIPNIYS